ncbi:MAG: hypothetical protein J6A77_00885, partial [Lachnospiraceae bacterium]|nr:hypothetical protein [Lachnospiraceae bacterium]
MKKMFKKWFLTFLAFVMTLSLWGCNNPKTGELAVEILDEVVDILLEEDSGESVTTTLNPTETPEPTATPTP